MIDTIKNEELKIKQEDLLKNMKMLRHTVADMLGSKSFLRGLTPGAQNGLITVNEEQFPVYITANTLAADGLPEITDDIYDEDNYLSLVSDDDIMWYALVEHLTHQIDLLQEDNNKYSDELVDANEEIDKLKINLAEEIKARQGYEESLKQIREELTAADNEIEGLEESLREANKKCTEYARDIDKLEVDNKRLSERVKTLVIEKSGKLENSDDTTEKPVSEIVKECVDKPDLAEKYEELQEKNRILRWSYNNLRSVFNSTYGVNVADVDDMQRTITKETFTELTARINELETQIKDKDERINQMSKNNDALSIENRNLGDLLKEADRNVRFYAREVDNLEKQISDLQSKALSDEEDIIDENHDNKPEKFGEATRAGEAFAQSIEMDMETALMQQQIAQLNTRIAQLEEKLKSTETELTTAMNANGILKTQIAALMDEKKEAELLAYRLTRGEMHVQFDSMKSLEHENGVLKNENADLNQKLYQKDNVLEPKVVTANDDMKYTVSIETMNEVTARIKELESINANLQEENESLKKKLDAETAMINSALSRNEELETENKELRKDNEDFTSIATAHIETTTKFSEYKDRQKRLYKHFRNLAEMIEDLMELG